ncbi:MAG: phosphate/phosphite/phosphonate ABC transporter substrate-binding protein [Caulobacteraceae bacterium]
MMVRRAAMAALAAALILAGCAKTGGGGADSATLKPDVINFSILSAEDQQSMASVWQPLLDDMQKDTGLKVKAFYASNYTALVEAMRFKQVQVGWFSANPAVEATKRADAEVLGRIIDKGGEGGTYESVLITRKGSGITLDDVLKCGKRYTFGIGDAESTSGTLAPMTYVFMPHNIEPTDCFKTVRSASHQSNMFSVANGVLDVATNNTVGILFAKRENPALAAKIQVIWTSPPLPESCILVRKDLDPAIKEKLRHFFLTYGTQPGPEGDRQRKVLDQLTYGGFRQADDSYLDPVRQMQASQALSEAKRSGDAAKIAAAQKDYDAIAARIAGQAKAAS